MALPVGLPTVEIEFGPYTDLAGDVSYAGAQGQAVAVHPETFEPIEVYLADTGQLITDRPVIFVLGSQDPVTGTTGPMVKPNTGETMPDNFAIKITFPAYGPSPEDRIIAIPPGAPDVVDYDDLVEAESEPAISVPMAASLAQVNQALADAQADADAAAGAAISSAASAATAAAAAGTAADDATAAATSAADAADSAAVTVTTGAVVGDNLILTKLDTTTVNAGNVRGPKGDPGDLTPSLAVTVSGTLTWPSVFPVTRVYTLSGNLTIPGTPSSVALFAGTVTAVFKQAASGGPYTVTWPASLEWANDAPAPAMPTVANAEMIVHLFWTGSVWRAMFGGFFFP